MVDKGKMGEDFVYESVNGILERMDFDYRIARNTILPFKSVYGEAGIITAEFDISVFTPYYVFLIEVKNELYTEFDYTEPLWKIGDTDTVSNPLAQNHVHKKVFCSEMNIPREKVFTIEVLLENGKCKNSRSPYKNDYVFDASDLQDSAKYLLATESLEIIDIEELYRNFMNRVNAHQYSLEEHKTMLRRTEKIETRIRRVLGWNNLHRTDVVICSKCKKGYLFFRDKLYKSSIDNSRASRHYFLGCSNYGNRENNCEGLIYVDAKKNIDEFKKICPISIEQNNDWGEEKVINTLLDEFENVKKECDSLKCQVVLLKMQRSELNDKLKRCRKERKQYANDLEKLQRENNCLQERLDSFMKIIGNIYLFSKKDNT